MHRETHSGNPANGQTIAENKDSGGKFPHRPFPPLKSRGCHYPNVSRDRMSGSFKFGESEDGNDAPLEDSDNHNQTFAQTKR